MKEPKKKKFSGCPILSNRGSKTNITSFVPDSFKIRIKEELKKR